MPKHPEHLCRFNDGEQTCECYDKGIDQERQRIREEVEKIKEPSLTKCVQSIRRASEDNTFMNGYNQALEDVLNKILKI